MSVLRKPGVVARVKGMRTSYQEQHKFNKKVWGDKSRANMTRKELAERHKSTRRRIKNSK